MVPPNHVGVSRSESTTGTLTGRSNALLVGGDVGSSQAGGWEHTGEGLGQCITTEQCCVAQ